MRSNTVKLAILAALGTIPGIGAGQLAQAPQEGLTGFLERIGGSTDIRLLDRGNRPGEQPTARFVGNNAVIGVRYFRNSDRADGLADANRARAAFDSECVASGGIVEPEESPVTRQQLRWASDGLPDGDRRGLVEYRAVVSVCTRAAMPIGAMAALVEDRSAFVRGDAGASIMSVVAPIQNRTAVYAFKASSVDSQADLELRRRQGAARMAEERLKNQHETEQAVVVAQAEQRRLTAWRKTATIGTRTSCGLIVDQRGPLVQVQLPADTTLDGTRLHWVERASLNDAASSRECRL